MASNEYASELNRAQQLADAALRDAEAAQESLTSARKSIDVQREGMDGDSDGLLRREQERERQALLALSRANQSLREAKEVRDVAARRAADAINDVHHDDGLKDGWTDKFEDWVQENADWLGQVSAWAGRIALWAGVAALALGWIPVIGQALAALATIVALVASVVALATDLVLVLGGAGSWKSVALDAVGVATFGIGRAAVLGAQAAAAGSMALARSNLFRQAMASGRKPNAAWNLANRGTQGMLRGREAAHALANAPKGPFPNWSNIREGFSPVAVARDAFDATRSVGNALSRSRWQDAVADIVPPTSAGTLDPALARAAANIDGMAPAASGQSSVARAVENFGGQVNVWVGATSAGVAAGAEGAYGAVNELFNGGPSDS
ncbi:hypothetical protein [Streptomyces sp. WMMC905]|uniref:hypothetical protein n=1 Tax=Streptomyces sp. WMMC905 TaxID=3404123 RepID=UPI003B95675D